MPARKTSKKSPAKPAALPVRKTKRMKAAADVSGAGFRLADPIWNAHEILAALEMYASFGVGIVVFPELCVTGASCGDNDQIRVSGDRGHIFGPCMADRYRSVLLDQHHRGGFADDQAPADDNCLFTGAVIAIMVEDLHAGLGRTGRETDLLACKDAGHG